MMGRSVRDFFWLVWFIFVVGFHFSIFAAYSVTVHYYCSICIKKIWSRALLQEQQDPKYSVTYIMYDCIESETGDITP